MSYVVRHATHKTRFLSNFDSPDGFIYSTGGFRNARQFTSLDDALQAVSDRARIGPSFSDSANWDVLEVTWGLRWHQGDLGVVYPTQASGWLFGCTKEPSEAYRFASAKEARAVLVAEPVWRFEAVEPDMGFKIVRFMKKVT